MFKASLHFIKMRIIISLIIISVLSTCSYKKINESIVYPQTKKISQIDTYFGVQIADPYRWLEDDHSKETAAWVEEQNKITFEYLNKIPYREKVKQRLTELWNFPKFSAPFKEGNYYFYFKNDGIQNQSVLYVQDIKTKESKVLLDPNNFSEDGTISLNDIEISHDGKYLAYNINKGGSDWGEIHVMEIKSGNILKDQINWVKFSGIAWKDNGFYYSRYDKPKKEEALSQKNQFHKVYYHKIGSQQSEDVLIYENKKFPLRNYYALVTNDENFLIIGEKESTSGNSLYCKTLKKNDSFKLICEGFKNDYFLIENISNNLLVLTNRNAPKYRLVLIDAEHPEESRWKEILPEKEEVLLNVSLAKNKIIAHYMKDANSKMYVYDLAGNFEKEIRLPTLGTVGTIHADKKDSMVFYTYASFTLPTTVFSYNINTATSEVLHQPSLNFKLDEFETKQVFYKSKDGTKIPMFIVHKKGIKLDGKNPTLLFGYGGFNISKTPEFKIERLVFLEKGGVFAMPNLRGGGEYGEEWHRAGTILKKQNVFDDFISAAEFLIKGKYTSSGKLAIAGRSNGGLLVGAAMTQRPELFKVAIPTVGVLDMLRFHKFTIGWAWVNDYGSSEDSVQFNHLLKYSPLHNIKEGVNYPATLVTTADHDDRVVPAHSFKFIATLQEKYKGNNPVLIRIDKMAGHGSGKPTSKLIEEYADVFSFIMYNLGMEM